MKNIPLIYIEIELIIINIENKIFGNKINGCQKNSKSEKRNKKYRI